MSATQQPWPAHDVACVDLFCGAGGLTHGFILEDVPVVAGIDLDPACRFPYMIQTIESAITAEQQENKKCRFQ